MKESAVLKQVMDYLQARRVFAFRLGTGAFFFEHRAFRAHSLGPGAADILALPQGKPPVWIEVKATGGRQRAEQCIFEAVVLTEGHKYVLAYSIDDLEGIL
jgi:hypothetical protein